ncbi:MAG TPA: M48 family metallopeptidase [Gallionellaceae bacterium]|nr:M48 family metallopeptidase [Gallionellaceae bacterium]
MNLLYKNEKKLFIIMLVISMLAWIGLLVGTMGIVLIYVLAFFVFYVMAQSAFISYLKGTGVEITADQFPDLHEKIVACSNKLGMEKTPEAYLLHMGGAFNALATRFLGKNFIVLYSDIVDALEEHPDALNFYVGHEIGHLKRKHLVWGSVLAPAAFLPIIGTAYSRAKEYTCDRHGLAVCAEPASAQLGLAAIAAGAKRWRSMNQETYVSQTRHASGFWMSLHELISDYPWLTKRIAAMRALANGEEAAQPRRHLLSWFFALFIPRLGVGGAASGIVVIAMIGVLAAIAIPAYQDYVVKAQVSQAITVGRSATAAVENYYYKTEGIPASLKKAGFVMPPNANSVKQIEINPKNAVVIVTLATPSLLGKSIAFVPSLDDNKRIQWRCVSDDVRANLLPKDCQ